MTQRYFGEIEVSSTDQGKYIAHMDCKSPYPVDTILFIHNEFGHFYGRRKFRLKKGKSTLTFPLIDIEPGRYGVCIEADGKTYLRHLLIDKPAVAGLISKLRQYISMPKSI